MRIVNHDLSCAWARCQAGKRGPNIRGHQHRPGTRPIQFGQMAAAPVVASPMNKSQIGELVRATPGAWHEMIDRRLPRPDGIWVDCITA